MGLFGPSKREVELEKKLKEAVREKNKLISDFEDWKEHTLNPHIAKLEGKIKTQNLTLEEVGALSRLEVEELTAKAQIKLNRLEEEYENRKSKIDSDLNKLLSKADQESKTQAEFIQAELKKLHEEVELKKSEVRDLKNLTIQTKDTIALQDLGFFDYSSPAESSVQLASKLEHVRSRIKDMLKNDLAASVNNGFSFNGSAAQGKKFTSDMKKLMLRAYNAEAENAIKSTKNGNIQTVAKRLEKTRESAHKLGQFIELTISSEFHSLRLQEIELASEHLKALKFESEVEKENRARLREEAKVEAEIKKQKAAREAERKQLLKEFEARRRQVELHKKEKLEKEKSHYENVAESPEVQADEAALEAIRVKLEDAEKAISDLDYREANTKAGYVYVLSNIGAFGENIVKIGMTRRLEPKERVKELSGASVPFIFDTHLMVFSDNARGLEHELHKRFSPVRVNKINPRKEYFYTTPEDVLAVLEEMDVTVVEFTKSAEALEYRSGLESVNA